MGFLMGLLLGAVAALLYSPKAGDEMREEMRMRTDELKKRADDLQRIAQKLAGEAQTKGRELIDDAKQEWSGATAGTSGSTTGSTTGSTPRSGRPTGTA
ncbi:MAG TPA: YtxH domain-containing protein [Candidatus Limnocylindria bacterium]|nr:YtxH domain-containing protein [Candidatus Limnocylindria bacterium]